MHPIAEASLQKSAGYFLTSDRLGFRLWRADDLPWAVALWTSADVMRHMHGPMTPEQAAARLAQEMERQEQLGIQYWPMFLKKTDEHVGCAGLRPFHDQDGVLEVGVHVHRAFWSGRFGEEAARTVIDFAWRYVAKALVAGHGPENVNSKALIERLGFRFTHREPWGPRQLLHPYYRLERPEGF